jgi:hypothetical protein
VNRQEFESRIEAARITEALEHAEMRQRTREDALRAARKPIQKQQSSTEKRKGVA